MISSVAKGRASIQVRVFWNGKWCRFETLLAQSEASWVEQNAGVAETGEEIKAGETEAPWGTAALGVSCRWVALGF